MHVFGPKHYFYINYNNLIFNKPCPLVANDASSAVIAAGTECNNISPLSSSVAAFDNVNDEVECDDDNIPF